MGKINSTNKLYDIINEHPDVKDIMVELGFKDIIKPGMLQSVGKLMTIEKGIKMKNISWDLAVKKFKEHGYVLI